MTSSEIIIEKEKKSASARGITHLVGIFGFPAKHSLSPAMHNAAFKVLHLNDWEYLSPFEIPSEELKSAIDAVRKYGLEGVNVTVPHKEKVIQYLDEIDKTAREIGAVNTIKNLKGHLIGYNTDVYGFIEDMKEWGVLINPHTKTLIIGAGGAAHAVIYGLKSQDVKEIFIYDIIEKKSQELAAKFKINQLKTKNTTCDFNLIVNASPVGMKENDPEPLTQIIGENFWKELAANSREKNNIFIYDLVYNRQTKLLEKSESCGIKSRNGIGMLLHQGARAFEIWTGKKAPIDIMKKTLLEELEKKKN